MVYQRILERVSQAFQKMMKGFLTDSEQDRQRSLRGAPRDPQRIQECLKDSSRIVKEPPKGSPRRFSNDSEGARIECSIDCLWIQDSVSKGFSEDSPVILKGF